VAAHRIEPLIKRKRYQSTNRTERTMDPDAVEQLCSSGEATDVSGDDGRVHHGGTADPFVLDFSANTNPVTPDGVTRVFESSLSAATSYPSDKYYEFRAAAAEYVGCDAPAVIPAPGGLAAIRLAIATTVDPGERVAVPSPSFGEYAREVRLQGGEPESVPHDELLGTDPEGYALAVVCNPNNPTGGAYDAQRLRAYADRCRNVGTALLVDEAFLGFTDEPTLAGRPGVIVARSLTKLFGLPGLRAGFAVAAGNHRDRLDTARRAWGLGSPAAAVGTHCMTRDAFVAATRERVRTERTRMADRLAARFDVVASDAPFLLLAANSSAGVDELLATLRGENIAVRDARTFRGLDRHVRVAVRLPRENDLLLDALDV
jgi:histidinol-phosphate aminotransferase/threonine-phosphate decarboxylase